MFDVAIIGCGVIGAACAYELSKKNLKVAIIEKENDVASGTTKANSAIIHAGYDPKPGTEMARLNVEGNRMVADICKKLCVPYKQIGSLVLAFSESEMEHVRELYERGVANEVPGVRVIDREEVKALEPNVSDKVCGALYAPSAGVISPWEFALAMAETAVRNGAEIFLSSPVESIENVDGLYRINTPVRSFEAKYVLNCAGVFGDVIHEMVGEKEFTIIPTKGEYYLLDKSEGKRVSRVIFQCPDEKGKGVLVSPTVHGNLIVGPDATVCEREDVSNTQSAMDFLREMSTKSVPSIAFRDNIRNFAGVRANHDRDDFVIGESKTAKNFVNVACIKSPGLSAAPAIAQDVMNILASLGLEMTDKEEVIDERYRVHFNEMSAEEKNELIRRNPLYGRVICRCETVTEGEIVDAIHSPILPRSINAIKRRVGAGMGRCQGGFCGPRVQEILARELGVSQTDIVLESDGTFILTSETKGGAAK
ncbi:MAG: NAD(P)/FAD-dependent oxidoreductase [Oscillospiraceae bacterium]|nr:NAD(P)/FAD-dependent oxidoreductase [Oscillospiraceae bacterium]